MPSEVVIPGLLVALLACGDKRQAEPVAPTNGSSPAPIAADAALVATPSRIALRVSGQPPIKTTRPLAREQVAKLAAIELDGLAKTVRDQSEASLVVEYLLAEPPIRVSVTAQPCLRCLPMQLDRWRAEADALRVTIPPELRDRADTTFDIHGVSLGGAPAIATHQVAFVAGQALDHAVAVYWNDGTNELRVIAAFTGTADSRDALTRTVTRAELEQLALAVLDRHARAW